MGLSTRLLLVIVWSCSRIFLNLVTCPPAGQSQRSCLVLVASCCSSVGESCPAHHPRHDLTQRPPHRHPQSAHLCHTQKAAVITHCLGRYVTGQQSWLELRGFLRTSDVCLSEWFIDSFLHHSSISSASSCLSWLLWTQLSTKYFFSRVFIFSSVHPLFRQSPSPLRLLHKWSFNSSDRPRSLSLLFWAAVKTTRHKLWHLRSPVHLPVSLLEQERASSA